MDIKRVNTYAKVGMFLIEAQVYVNGEVTMRKVMSRPIGEKDLEKFLQIRRDLRGTKCAPNTKSAIRSMNDGNLLFGQFTWIFDNLWPEMSTMRAVKIYQVTENGLEEVEVTF